MITSKLKSILDIGSSCAVLIFVAWIIMQPFLRGRFSAATARERIGVKRGMTVPKAKALLDSDRVLVIAMSSHCPYCARSLPLIAELVKFTRESRLRSQIIGVFPPNDHNAHEFLLRGNIEIPITASLAFNDIGVRVTPTFLVLDRSATVREIVVGQLSDDSAATLRKALTTETSSLRTPFGGRLLAGPGSR